jgi:hypothetical protein
MEIQPAFLVLADISGYTRFIAAHRMALAHAEAAITDLLESVINSSRHPLRLNKLEGDAALFFALAPPTAVAAVDILEQVKRFFPAFYSHQARMTACDCCGCPACRNLKQLNLKAIVHRGDVALKKVRRFEELAGESVILAHRLLKNSVTRDRYVLISEPVASLAPRAFGERLDEAVERYDELGEVKVFIWEPPEYVPDPNARLNPPRAMLQYLSFQWHWLLRSLGLRRQRFPNLEAACNVPPP